jgi:hypothetical protein
MIGTGLTHLEGVIDRLCNALIFALHFALQTVILRCDAKTP